MKKTLAIVALIAPLAATPALAETTFGIGFGSLYSGLGLNFGRASETSLLFGSIGCIGGSSSITKTSNGSTTTKERSNETNCGVGFGYLSSALFSSNKHALGLNLSYSYDTQDDGESQLHLMPGYHYFLNGIGSPGLNLGLGSRLTFTEDDPVNTTLNFTIGYQF